MPENGEAGGVPSGTEHYYSFDYGDIHFIMLDSQDSDRTHEGDMMRWLKEDLRKNTGLWTIVAFHHPPYTKGSHDSDSRYDSRGRMQDMRENFLPVLEAAGVDIVLSGHSHMYERSYLIDCYYGDSDQFSEKNVVSTGQDGSNWDYLKPKPVDGKLPGNQGTIYIVAGSTSKVDQGPMDHPAHVAGLLEAGSVVIDVVEDTLTARFINQHGKVSDGFRITKQAGVDLGYPGCKPEALKALEQEQGKDEAEGKEIAETKEKAGSEK
jgi:3',5'-cyclic AMP phosphodiesterase CpdA